MKFIGKWMKLENNHPERGKSDPERQKQYILTQKWLFDPK